MKITEITKDDFIKIGKTSITVKNMETNKTKGVINGIYCGSQRVPRKDFDILEKLRKAGIFNTLELLKNCILVGDELYYFYSLNLLDFYAKNPVASRVDTDANEKLEREETRNKQLEEKGIKVIRCRFL